MVLSREVENSLIRLQQAVNNYYTDTFEIDYEKYISKTGIFSLFYQNQGALTIIYDIKNCKVVDISKNLTNFTGYNRKEFYTNITLGFVSLLAPEHISLISVFATWIQKVLKIKSLIRDTTALIHLCKMMGVV